MAFRPTRFVRRRAGLSRRRPGAFGRTAVLLLVLCGVEGASAQELPRELAFGLPESAGQQMENAAKGEFCPLGVCRPRRRDSLMAGAGFALAALGSAWLGRHRLRDSR